MKNYIIYELLRKNAKAVDIMAKSTHNVVLLDNDYLMTFVLTKH